MTVPRILPTATNNEEQPAVRRKDQPTDATPDMLTEPRLSCLGKVSGQHRDDVESEYSSSIDETTYSEIFGGIGWLGYDTVAMSTILSDGISTTTSEYGHEFSTTASEWDAETKAEMRSVGKFLRRFRRESMEEERVNEQADFSVIREVAKFVSLYSFDVEDDDLNHDDDKHGEGPASNNCRKRHDASNFASGSLVTRRDRSRGCTSHDEELNQGIIEQRAEMNSASEGRWFSKEARIVTKEKQESDRENGGETHSDKKVIIPMSRRGTSPRRDSGILFRGAKGTNSKDTADKSTVPLELPRPPIVSKDDGMKKVETIVDVSKIETTARGRSPRHDPGTSAGGAHVAKRKGSVGKRTVPLELPRPPTASKDDGIIVEASKKEQAKTVLNSTERPWTWIHDQDQTNRTGETTTLQRSRTTKGALSSSVAAKTIMKSKEEIDVRSGVPFGMSTTEGEFEIEKTPRATKLNMDIMSSAYQEKKSPSTWTRNLKHLFIAGRPRAQTQQRDNGERRSLRNMIWKARAELDKSGGGGNNSNTPTRTIDICGALLCFCTD